jgi:hypothetical protein
MKSHGFRNSSITPKNVFEVLKKNNVHNEYGDEIFDLCLWFITWVYNEMMKWKNKSVPMYSGFLRIICSHHDKLVIEILTNAGIIIKTKSANYFTKVCTEYSINDEFTACKTNPLIPRYYRSDTLLRRINRNYHLEMKQNILNRNLENNFLFKMLTEKISFDGECAIEYLNSTYLESSSEYKLRFDFISFLQEKFIWGHYAKNCNRFYSIFTQLPSDLRAFIIIDNQKSNKVYFDICNSQVQLFVHDILMKNKNLLDKKDSTMFFDLISSVEKDFYSEMINILEVNETRETIKPLFSNLLYNINTRFIGLVDDSKIKEFYEKFKLHFPTVWKYLQTIKANKKTCSKFAVTLMNIESDFILNKVAKRLNKDKISLVTIHDGFLVNEEHEAIAEQYFVEESLKYFGQVLKFKKEMI